MKVETFELAPGYVIPRIIRGGWQLAGDHGEVDRERAIADMAQFVAAGINTFDCADIYTGVEATIGEYRKRDPSLQVHTKFVPDLEDLPRVDEAYVRRINARSRERLHADALLRVLLVLDVLVEYAGDQIGVDFHSGVGAIHGRRPQVEQARRARVIRRLMVNMVVQEQNFLEMRGMVERVGTFDLLKGKILANLFYEPSTRTSSSFTAAPAVTSWMEIADDQGLGAKYQ